MLYFGHVDFLQGDSTSDDGLLDPEIKLRSDRRRISLMSLLDENQSVMITIAEQKRRRFEFRQQQTLSIDSESSRSECGDPQKLSAIVEDIPSDHQAKQQQQQQQQLTIDITPTAATGAVPKNRASIILPSIIVPASTTSGHRGRLGKARSVSPSSLSSSSAAQERNHLNVKRQSSVPLKFDDASDAANKSTSTSASTDDANLKTDAAAKERDRKVIIDVAPIGATLQVHYESSE